MLEVNKALKVFVIALLAVCLLVSAAAFFYDRIFVYLLSRTCGIDIAYKSAAWNPTGEISFKTISLRSRKGGIGILSREASVLPHYSLSETTLDFRLKDVRFAKGSEDKPVRYDTLTALLASPLNSAWQYNEINGEVVSSGKELKVKYVEAKSSDIKLSLKGALSYLTGVIDADIMLYFSPGIQAKMPPELIKTLLVNKEDGWKTLSVKLSGDLNKPSIQLTSKLFRLKISSV